jgi:hypothetical protein
MVKKYICKIIINNLPKMDKKQVKQLSNWLRMIVDDIEKTDRTKYSKIFKATLYK